MADAAWNEYQRLRAWLRGTKPRARGRTWRRVARAMVPDRFEPHVGDGVGLAVAGLAGGLLGCLAPLGLILYSKTVVPLILDSLFQAQTVSPEHAPMLDEVGRLMTAMSPMVSTLLDTVGILLLAGHLLRLLWVVCMSAEKA